MSLKKRTIFRKNAFICCFSQNINLYNYDDLISSFSETEEISFDNFSKELIKLYFENQEKVDVIIKKYLKNWTLNRLPKCSLILIRLCIIEIMFIDSIPFKVSINEYVELSKYYCDEKDVSFINGLLASFVSDYIKE